MPHKIVAYKLVSKIDPQKHHLQEQVQEQEHLGISSVDKLYQENFNKCLYYCWIQQSTNPRLIRRSNSFGSHIFQQVARHHSVKYTPIACTITTNVNLECGDFEKLYATVFFNPSLESHALEQYVDLTHFLQSSNSYKRFKYIPLIGLDQTPQLVGGQDQEARDQHHDVHYTSQEMKQLAGQTIHK